MTDGLMMTVIALLLIVCILQLVLLKRSSKSEASLLATRIDSFEQAQQRAEYLVRDEMTRNREEWSRAQREQRQELAEAFKGLSENLTETIDKAASQQKENFREFANTFEVFSRNSTIQFEAIRTESGTASKNLREEVTNNLKGIATSNAETMGQLSTQQQSQLEAMSTAINKLALSVDTKLEAVRITVDGKLKSMQDDNAKQIEQMRLTVDEKLQGTLEKRLTESFKHVSDRLELVHKGLGEMQSLASGVGDLKKVLTNVKTRGTWGEIQLGALLEQVLTSEQYATNFAPNGGSEHVEFAIKLPGQGDGKDQAVWLPLDAKFPLEDYQRLLDAQEHAEADAVEAAGKQLEARVKQCARDISEKYLNPPVTTDFGILFLPIEGLFAEVIRRPGLTEVLQREHRVVVAGPTTLWSILNSLQMGFRTLAIQKRSSEVWNLLGAIKTEWAKYSDVLDAVQKKLNQASDTIEKAQVRTRAVSRKLRSVEALPASEAAALISFDIAGSDDMDEEALPANVGLIDSVSDSVDLP